jgi:hypothetical protein
MAWTHIAFLFTTLCRRMCGCDPKEMEETLEVHVVRSNCLPSHNSFTRRCLTHALCWLHCVPASMAHHIVEELMILCQTCVPNLHPSKAYGKIATFLTASVGHMRAFVGRFAPLTAAGPGRRRHQCLDLYAHCIRRSTLGTRAQRL